jgi:hypothetical protein
VTEAVITALHRALRADLAVRVRYQSLHEPGTTVTGILVPTAFDFPRALYIDEGETVRVVRTELLRRSSPCYPS